MAKAVGAGLVCAMLCMWGAAVASAKGRLPAGTPYAAEIRVTLDYDGTFTKSESFSADCLGADGDITQTVDETQQEHIDRTILFKHITVPVVPAFALGKAAQRLALKPTVTDPGQATSEHSTYDITGHHVTDDSTCPQGIGPFACGGAITNIGKVSSFTIATGDGFNPDVYYLSAFGYEVSDPESCDDAGQTNVATQLGITATDAYPEWQQVKLQGLLGSRFYALKRRRVVTFSVPIGPAIPCNEPDALSCTQSVTGTARIKMQRLFLYKTKKSYPK